MAVPPSGLQGEHCVHQEEEVEENKGADKATLSSLCWDQPDPSHGQMVEERLLKLPDLNEPSWLGLTSAAPSGLPGFL